MSRYLAPASKPSGLSTAKPKASASRPVVLNAAHTATARRAYQDGPTVAAVLADLESAPVEDGLRATLRMLGKLTREGKVGADDMRRVLSAGVSHQQVQDALAVCAAFNVTGRLAEAFGFEVLSPEGFEAGAKYLLKRGYR